MKVKLFLNNKQTNTLPTWMQGYITGMIKCIQTELGVCFDKHVVKELAQF